MRCTDHAVFLVEELRQIYKKAGLCDRRDKAAQLGTHEEKKMSIKDNGKWDNGTMQSM